MWRKTHEILLAHGIWKKGNFWQEEFIILCQLTKPALSPSAGHEVAASGRGSQMSTSKHTPTLCARFAPSNWQLQKMLEKCQLLYILALKSIHDAQNSKQITIQCSNAHEFFNCYVRSLLVPLRHWQTKKKRRKKKNSRCGTQLLRWQNCTSQIHYFECFLLRDSWYLNKKEAVALSWQHPGPACVTWGPTTSCAGSRQLGEALVTVGKSIWLPSRIIQR
jgi:hypothetical protein